VGEYGEGICGWRNEFVGGADVFACFVTEGKEAITTCIREGLARPGRIAVAGTSWGAYMALRLMAGDVRVAAGAGFAPVTDWRRLREFSDDRERADVAVPALHRFAGQLAGHPVYLAIGGSDGRVSTEACVALARELREAGGAPDEVCLNPTSDEGHCMGPGGYAAGASLLLRALGDAPVPAASATAVCTAR